MYSLLATRNLLGSINAAGGTKAKGMPSAGPMTDGKRTTSSTSGEDGPRRPSVFAAARRGRCRTPRRTRWHCLSYPEPVAGGDGHRPGGAGVRASGGQERPRGAGVRAFCGGGRRVLERVRGHLRGIAAAGLEGVSEHLDAAGGEDTWWRRWTPTGQCWRVCVQQVGMTSSQVGGARDRDVQGPVPGVPHPPAPGGCSRTLGRSCW